MKKKNIFRAIRLLTLPVFMLFLISSCMETSYPDKSATKNLTIAAFYFNTDNPLIKVPIRNATVIVSEPGQNTSYQSLTNDRGYVNMPLTVPLAGKIYDVTVYNYSNSTLQKKSGIIVCRDTTIFFLFDTSTVKTVNCTMLDYQKTIVFIDDLGSTKLRQFTPENINKYERCALLFTNNATETVYAKLPALQAPFSYSTVFVNGFNVAMVNGEYQIPPNGSLQVCYYASTLVDSVFDRTSNIELRCSNNQKGTYKVRLQAEVIKKECNCDESVQFTKIQLPDKVEVGASKDIQNLVYTNNGTCPETIDKISFDGNDGWSVLSPTFPVTLAPGNSLSILARFKALRAGISTDTLKLKITPQGGTNTCNFDVYLEGEGCSAACPFISVEDIIFKPFSSNQITDTLASTPNGRVFVSVLNVIPPLNSVVTKNYYIKIPDTACSASSISIRVNYRDLYSPKYFSVSPQSLYLAPGEEGIISVKFTAPTLEELNVIIASRGRTGKTIDSLFGATVSLRGSGSQCNQVINDYAVVTVYPEISPIINLRAYNQKTSLKPEPENEVYSFGDNARTINKGAGNTPGEFPPLKGNIWLNVDNNDVSANPPQEPILNSNFGIGMKVWTNIPEAQFSNIARTYNDFVASNYSSGYSTAPLRNLKVGDVIAFQIGPKLYSLVYIRRIDNGTEATSSKQTGIEFRSMYPILIP